MKAHLMFTAMPVELGQEIAGWLRDTERDVYRSALMSLAAQRKLRPVFVTRKSKVEQAQFMLDQLKLRLNEAIGENLLQVWLMKGHSDMLVNFLDGLGVPHDGRGGIDGEIPTELPADKVNAAVAGLLAAFPAGHVAVYLNLFQLQQLDGWPTITAAIEADPRLRFEAAA